MTIRNSRRDAINAREVVAFSATTKETLHSFYSRDLFSSSVPENTRPGQRKSKTYDPKRASNIPEGALQEKLWDTAPGLSKHRAGCLRLCRGMPVMLKYNDATELCATNGAEGKVYDWQSHISPSGKEELETLFVKLINPSRHVAIDGLPEDVVPINTSTDTVTVHLPGTCVSIQRKQVFVLPNFAMTDFGCQGRTREYNVVDLTDCRSHLCAYTCLSRGSSKEGTLIVSELPDRHLQGGANGDLCSEFRALELLDEITTLQHNSLLTVNGCIRSDVLQQYSRLKGADYVPRIAHASIKTHCNTTEVDDEKLPRQWGIIGNQNVCSKRQHEDGLSSATTLKARTDNVRPSKKRCTDSRAMDQLNLAIAGPSYLPGCKWDSIDYSCAYDSVITPLFNVCRDIGNIRTNTLFAESSPIGSHFSHGIRDISRYENGDVHLSRHVDRLRDIVRDELSNSRPLIFTRRGNAYASAVEVLDDIMRPVHPYCSVRTYCVFCGSDSSAENAGDASYMFAADATLWSGHGLHPPLFCRTSKLLSTYLCAKPGRRCSQCGCDTATVSRHMNFPLSVFHVDLSDFTAVTRVMPEMHASFSVDGSILKYRLYGIVYVGHGHFSSRFVDLHDRVWFHDGQLNDGRCVLDSTLHPGNDNTEQLLWAGGKQACALMYVLEV